MSHDLQFQRDWVTVREPGFRLSVVDLGPRDAPAVLFLHGGAGALVQWRNQLGRLSSEMRTVAFDFRGHGESEVPRTPLRFEEFVDDVRQVVAQRGLPDRFILAGHSFGGAVASAYAAEEPGRVDRLILVATAGRIPLLPWTPYLLKLPVSVLNGVRRFFRNRINCSPAVLKKLVPMLMEWDGWDLFPRITAPTMVIGGEWDWLTRPDMVRRMAELIPGSELEFVKHAGHLPHLERPAAVTRLLERFVRPERARATSWRGTLEVPGEAG